MIAKWHACTPSGTQHVWQVVIMCDPMYKKVAYRHCLDSAPEKPKFQVGDHVWYYVVMWKLLGPVTNWILSTFVIYNQVNNVTFLLDLPSYMHLHPLFHVSLLKPWTLSFIPNQVAPPPPLVELAEGPKYEVKLFWAPWSSTTRYITW